MLLALEDYNATASRSGIRIVSHLRDSKKDDVEAAFAAIYLLKDVQVQAIFGPQMSTQTDFVIDLGKRVKVPIISPATSPSLLVEENPFFIRGALPSSSQTKAIAAIVKNYDWREVVVIYEESPYGTGIVPHFTDALLKISSSTRVSIVHVQPFLASRLFIKAKEAGMMSSGYAWIITNVLTSLLDSIDPSVIESSMQGVLGVKPYVPRSNELHRFTKRRRKRFRQEYPDTDQVELNVFGLWAYDSITTLAEAVEEVGTTAILKSKKPDTRENLTDFDALGTSEVGSLLINSMQNAVLKTGLSGDFRIVDGELQASPFEIVNIVGKGKNHWNVFKEVIQSLPYAVPYEFIPFTNGLNLPVYDDVLHGITSLDYDAVVGDVTILARRSKYVDFTLPFTESGISAVVPVRDDEKRNAWIFLKPLKSELWITTGTFFVFIGFVVWVLEHRVNNEFRGPKHKQVGMIFWFSFSTLVFAHSAKITSNLTRFVLIVWVFVVLVLTSSYTASLTSMLTVQQLQPTITDLNDLIKNGEYVG
ncbi:Glutamate receptor 2.2 [Capsicum chinense]|nr:Glutamate receptor 2.2 [Capsicum chinense]